MLIYLKVVLFFFKQKTAYEMRISDWSSDVCSSDLVVWSLIRYLAPDSRWRCKADLSQGGVAPVESVRADGRDTVEVRLEQAAPLFLAELARLDCGGTGITHRD